MASPRSGTFYEHYNSTAQPKPNEDEMRQREMAADPMLNYFRDKEREKTGSSSKPIYRGTHLPNRFNIRPGYRWDGVDRSNGFEKKLLERETDKKAREEDEYRKATRDM